MRVLFGREKLWVFSLAPIIFIITKNPQQQTHPTEGRGFDQLWYNNKHKQAKELGIHNTVESVHFVKADHYVGFYELFNLRHLVVSSKN
jgi:hypothetical protein